MKNFTYVFYHVLWFLTILALFNTCDCEPIMITKILYKKFKKLNLDSTILTYFSNIRNINSARNSISHCETIFFNLKILNIEDSTNIPVKQNFNFEVKKNKILKRERI